MPALLVSFLQQAVASIGTIVGPLSACLPEDLVGTCSFRFFRQNCWSRTTSHSFVPFVQAFLNLQHLENDQSFITPQITFYALLAGQYVK